MSLRRLKWLTIALPLAFVAFLQVGTEWFLVEAWNPWQVHALYLVALALGVFLFASVIFGWLEHSQRATEARTRELEALNALGSRLSELVNRDAVIALTLDTTRDLLNARAAGMSTLDPGSRHSVVRTVGDLAPELERLLQSGAQARPGEARHMALAGGEPATLVTAWIGDRSASTLLHALLGPSATASLPAIDRLMQAVGNHAAAALERCRLFDDVQRRERRARALYQVSLEITSSQDVSRVLHLVTAYARDLVDARGAALRMVSEADSSLWLAETSGDATIFGEMVSPISEDNGWGERGASAEAVPARALTGTPDRPSVLRLPLIVSNRVVGELCVATKTERTFNDDERALLAGLADMAAIAIHNSRLLEQERQVAVLEERDHLAREMHDTIAQVLGYLHLKASATRRRLASGEIDHAEGELQEMEDLAHEAYVDVREAILGLRETVAPGEGIVGSISQYLQKFRRQSGITCELIVPDGVETALAPEAEVQLVRVIQEALTNVRKHAQATRVTVRLENSEGGLLRILAEDNGRGFDAARLDRQEGRSFGLRSMRERVERAGGQFSIDSAPGQGTRVVVMFPVQQGAPYVQHPASSG